MPDGDTSSTVVEEFKESYQLSAPSGTTGNWDAHVFNLPFSPESVNQFLTSAQCRASLPAQVAANFSGTGVTSQLIGSQDTVFAADTISSGVPLGLMNVHAFNTSGSPLMPSASGGVGYVWPGPQSAQIMGTQAARGRRRLISMGYEITNTTAPLYKQGTLTAYRLPQTAALATSICAPNTTSARPIFDVPNGTGNEPCSGCYPPRALYKTYNTPPASVGLAMEYAGSRQWEAKDGAYVAVSQDCERNQLAYNDHVYVAFADGDSTPEDYVNVAGNTYNALAATSVLPTTTTDGNCYLASSLLPTSALHLPFHTTGVILSGLSQQSTFTVTLRTLWEVAPVTGDGVATGPAGMINPLVPLAQPSAEYDPLALEMYQRAVVQLPVAVPVGMNAKGDFWDWCLGAVENCAGTVGNMLMPGAGGAVGGAIGKWAGNFRDKRNGRAEKEDQALDAQISGRSVKRAAQNTGRKPNSKPPASSQGPPPRPARPSNQQLAKAGLTPKKNNALKGRGRRG